MRKLLFIILLMIPAILLAAPVDPNVAQQVAQNFISSTGDSICAQQPTKLPRKLKRVAKHADNLSYYIFNNEDGGFVIVSGDDCATPILGYSDEGSIDLDNMPIQLQELLQAYTLEIQEAVDNNLQATEDVAKAWATYRRAPQAQTVTTAVNPLINTSWDQSPRYNNKCPVDQSLTSHGGHPATGCVATAMAQIMKYWEYPEMGKGYNSYKSQHYGTLSANFSNTTYEWANMPLKLTSSTTSAQNNAVALLMYHCGIAVNMNYNSDGNGSSGANTLDWGGGRPSAESALKKYFGYASTLIGKQSSSMSAADWKRMLKNELDNRRPMLYRGVSSQGGHCFICDGYDTNDYFHFNWGWGGQSNGYYTLTAGTSRSNKFSQYQCAVIGIKPADGTGPAKNYRLYMNSDLKAINTSSSSSSIDVNPYIYGNSMSFTAKVENNGTGVFNGSFRVAAFTEDGEFLAWSKESHHFSLDAGQVTTLQTFTFDGGTPFVPGRYRAYLYYKDDDDTEWDYDGNYVKTDHGVIYTEYNNVMFTIKIASGDLIPFSAFTPDEIFGSFISGSKLRIYVDIRNTALLTTFYGKVRLNFYNTDGTLAQVVEEKDFTKSGLSSSTTYNLNFFNNIEVDPGTYYLTLVYQKKNETTWHFMRCIETYPNFVKVEIKARPLIADNYEVNNTQAQASTLTWAHDYEMMDFCTDVVSLHNDADVDYYKLSFPNTVKYNVSVSLYDRYNNIGQGYNSADAQYSYSLGGEVYSSCYKNEQVISFTGPTILYLKVVQFGLNGLGYYEICGNVEEAAIEDFDRVETKTSTTKIFRKGQIFILRGGKTYTITGQIMK